MFIINGRENSALDPFVLHVSVPEPGEGLAVSNQGRVCYVDIPPESSESNRLPMRLVVDGQPGKTYDRVWGQRFSLDGKRLAFAATSGDRSRIIVDGKEGADFSDVSEPIFSANGRHIAYTATEGDTERVVFDSNRCAQYLRIDRYLCFAPDGKSVCYSAVRDDKSAVIAIAGTITREYVVLGVRNPRQGFSYGERTGPMFSPDGKHIACIIWGDGKCALWVDGCRSEWYDGAPTGGSLVFDDARTLRTIVIREGRVLSVKVRLSDS
jgi:Tol biopolymer transport system component